MSPHRTPARRLVAVLLLSLVAVLAPGADPAVVAADPVPVAAAGSDLVPEATGPHTAGHGRPAPGWPGPFPSDDGPVGHPGPALDVLLLAPVAGHPAPGPDTAGRAAGPDRGHGDSGDPRGPPRA